jgi:hypothetical protein
MRQRTKDVADVKVDYHNTVKPLSSYHGLLVAHEDFNFVI